MRFAVVLFNLGGPDSLEAVEPFLFNLFSDPAVIDLPGWLRTPVARFVARRRAPVARAIYAQLGGRSPILEETKAQADALASHLSSKGGDEVRVFVVMRCAPPFSDAVALEVEAFRPERIVLLPLYPQFSTSTSRSSFLDWYRAAEKAKLAAPHSGACCYPAHDGFIEATVDLIHQTFTRRREDVDYRLLLSAHGLPERTLAKGDPYRWQVERSADAIVDRLGIDDRDCEICFQSRVGPLRWIGPSTDDEIRRAGAEGKGVLVVPLAFVSEHSETMVELDIEYRRLAEASGVADYLRVPTVGTHPKFIGGLAELVRRALAHGPGIVSGGVTCPEQFRYCGLREQ